MYIHITAILMMFLNATCFAGNYFPDKNAAIKALKDFPNAWEYMEPEWFQDSKVIQQVKENNPFVYINEKGELHFKNNPEKVYDAGDQILFATMDDMMTYIQKAQKEKRRIEKPLALMQPHSEKMLEKAFKEGINADVKYILTQLESKKKAFPNKMSRLQLLEYFHKKIVKAVIRDGMLIVGKGQESAMFLNTYRRCAQLFEFTKDKKEKQQLYKTLLHLYYTIYTEAALYSTEDIGTWKNEIRKGEFNIVKIFAHLIKIPNPMTLLADGVAHIGQRRDRHLAVRSELIWSPQTETKIILKEHAEDQTWKDCIENTRYYKLMPFYYSKEKWLAKYPNQVNPLLEPPKPKEEKKEEKPKKKDDGFKETKIANN